MSFNLLLADQPRPEIAGSAVVLGDAHVGAGAILAQGQVVRAHGGAAAPLRSRIDGRAQPRLGRGRIARASSVNAATTRTAGRGVDAQFVVAAAKVLHEGMPGDDHLRCPISLQPAHRS